MFIFNLVNNALKPDFKKIGILRLISSVQSKNNENEIPAKTNKKPKTKKHSKEIEEYLYSSDHLIKVKYNIPPRLLKKNRKAPDDLFLVDSQVGKEIATIIKPYISQQNKTVIETNPCFGFITRELLQSGFEKLQIFESTVCFRKHLLNLCVEYPNRMTIYNRDLFSIWRLSYQDRYDNGNRVKNMLRAVEIKKWEQEPAMTIIGALATSNFIRHLIISLIFQFGIMTYGRSELFVALPPHLYLQLTASPKLSYLIYRASSVLFQILCDHEVLLKVPRKAYLPWDNIASKKTKSALKEFYNIDADLMYLCRIVFKPDLPTPVYQLKHLWYFVQHMMVSRRCKVIPTLEQWIPGCGVTLILENYKEIMKQPEKGFSNLNIFTETGELTADQFLFIFKVFSNLPEYSDSSFIAAMESSILKMESMQYIEEQNLDKVDNEESNELLKDNIQS